MDIGKRFRTDEQKETEGSWVKIDGSEFLIARNTNQAYVNALTKAMEENADAVGAGTPEADELDRKLLADAMADHILLGWKKVDLDGKKNVKYTKKLAAQVLMINDFRALIMRHSENIENFRAKVEKKQEKN